MVSLQEHQVSFNMSLVTKVPSGVWAVVAISLLVLFGIYQTQDRRGKKVVAQVEVVLDDLRISDERVFERSTLRTSIADALGLGESISTKERLELLRDLGSNLSEGECEALLAELSEHRGAGVDPGWHSEYIHAISLALQQQKAARERFARVLATVARDATRDEVVRDYALQHIRQVWDHEESESSLRARIEATLRELVAADAVIAPSSLLSLHLLGIPASGRESGLVTVGEQIREYHIPDADVEPLVLNLLKASPSASMVRARMTAARVSGDRRLGGCRGVLMQVVEDPSEHALVRMAAVNALGLVAAPSDLQYLSSLATEDRRIEFAIQKTLLSQKPSAQ